MKTAVYLLTQRPELRRLRAQSHRVKRWWAIVLAVASMALAFSAGLFQAFRATAGTSLPTVTTSPCSYCILTSPVYTDPAPTVSTPPCGYCVLTGPVYTDPTPTVSQPPCGPCIVTTPAVNICQVIDCSNAPPPGPTDTGSTAQNPPPPQPVPQVPPQAPPADTGSNNGGADVQTTTTVTTPSAADVVVPVIKPTSPQKPPPLPHRAPHQYGAVRLVQTGAIHNGLKVSFVFSARPQLGAQLQTTWYYNNKPIGNALKTMRTTVTTSVQSSSPLPSGYWRCTLRVRLPGGGWRELQEARQRLH